MITKPNPVVQAAIDRTSAGMREYIRALENATEPFTSEIIRLRGRVERLEAIKRKQQDRIDAMVQFFQCAAKGESEIAKAVQSIVEDFLVSDAE